MKIKELQEQILNEDWGNLKRLDKSTLDIIRTKKNSYQRNTPYGIGQNSELKLVNPKGTVFNTFLNNSHEYVGVVIRASSMQVLTIFGGRNLIILNKNYLKSIIDQYFDKHPEALIDNSKWNPKTPERIKADLFGDFFTFSSRRSEKVHSDILMAEMENVQIKSLITKTINLIKESGNVLTFWGITVDQHRQELSNTRVKGMNYLPQDSLAHGGDPHYYNKDNRRHFNDSARSAIKSRLEKFRAERATKTNTPEEFFNLLQQTGYMQKVNIGGYVYVLKAHDIRTSSIIGVPHPESYPKANPSNYIEYQYDSSLSPDTQQEKEFKEILKPYKDKWVSAPEKTKLEKADRDRFYDQYQEKQKELNQLMPPSSFKITFKMQGASIVPDKLIASAAKIGVYV